MKLTHLGVGDVFNRLADTMINVQALVAEFDAVLDRASSSRGTTILQKVTDLFFRDAASYSDDQVAVFGLIVNILIEKVDRKSLIELSGKFASATNAPTDVIRRLSRDEDIAISGPILELSTLLSDGDLLEVAGTRGKVHQSVIAGRNRLSETVTDGLINRGIVEVMRKIAENENARFSEVGFVKLIGQAKNDGQLAASISARKDIPAELQPFLKLALA